MTFTVEFPDFPAADMPAIPQGFIDRSWHNDTCPSFRNNALGLTLFVDYAEPANREFPDSVRFSLVREPEQVVSDADRAHLIESDDWEEVQAFILACTFAAQLADDIGADNVQTVIERNATPEYANACASHDFCDANVTMLSAWYKVFGRDPAFLSPSRTDDESNASMAFWGKAWAIAKENRFFVESGK